MKANLILFTLAVGGALLFSGCTAPDNGDDDRTLVEMQSPNKFEPETVTVEPGTTVVWINRDSISHNTVALNGEWESDLLRGGQQFEFTFDEPGIYDYRCEPHSFENDDGTYGGMVGRVVVLNEDGSTPAPGADTGGEGGNETA